MHLTTYDTRPNVEVNNNIVSDSVSTYLLLNVYMNFVLREQN